MSDFGVVFCGRCNSTKVDSGYETPSSLRCSECSNTKEFKVGKVSTSTNSNLNLEEFLNQAKKEAGIQ